MGDSISEFMNLCLKFESLMRENYKLGNHESAFWHFSRMEEFQSLGDDIHTVRNIRNFISHNEYKANDGSDAIEIKSSIFEYLKKVIDVLENPPTVRDRYIKNLYFTNTSAKLKDILKYMDEKQISHVPILNKNKVLIGVFSESTLFSKLLDDKIVGIDKDSIMKDYEEYTKIDNHASEYFAFIDINAKTTKAERLFLKRKNNKKLEMLFVTQNGKPDEPVLGILTPWEVL